MSEERQEAVRPAPESQQPTTEALSKCLPTCGCTFFAVSVPPGAPFFAFWTPKASKTSQRNLTALRSGNQKTYPRSVTALKSENQRFIKGISRLSEAEIKDLSQESQSSDSKSPGSGPEQKPGSITEFCARWRRACRDLCRLQYAAQAVWSPKEPEPPPKSSRTSRPGGVYFRVVSFSTLQVRTSAWKWM